MNDSMSTYTTIVGMEIHVELKTKAKMFCGCKNNPFHAEKPNIHTCPVCLGMPGGLPVPNKKAIDWTILLGLALGCDISLISKFDRKNYFYPDLAKGYQISQYDEPLCRNGKITISVQNPVTKQLYTKDIRIHRIHLEEDTGKLQHATIDNKKITLVDFNRSGVPLVEIVTEADIRSGEEAKVFLKALHQIIRALDISDADMEKGSMRLEPNISVKVHDKPLQSEILEISELPKYKVEVKNINSFNYVKKAIEYETNRHISLLKHGEVPTQETRGWNENKNETFPQRRKEDADDYRYFPDPDIPPLHFTQAYIDVIRKKIGELPQDKARRFVDAYGLNEQQSALLIDDMMISDLFEKTVALAKEAKVSPVVVANWIINKKIDVTKVKSESLLADIVKATTVVELAEADIQEAIEKVVANQVKAVNEFKSGKTGVFMFLLGMTIKELKGQGNKEVIKSMLEKKLGNF